MQRLKDIANLIYGAGRETPSIMSPAVSARKKLFGPGRRGKFEPGDLLEHLGDPGLLLGLGMGLPAMGMAAMARSGGRRGTKTLLRELTPRAGQLFPNPEELMGPKLAQELGLKGQKNLQVLGREAASQVPGSLSRPEISGAGGFFPAQAGAAQMSNQFGPVIRLKGGAAEGPTVPGKTPLAQALRQTSQPISREGQVTPEYELLTDKLLDLDNMDKPLPQFGGRTTRQVIDSVREKAEQQAQSLRSSDYGRPQTVPPRSVQSEFSGEMEMPWTRPLGQNPYSELLSETPQQAAPGEHLVTDPDIVQPFWTGQRPKTVRVPREELPFMRIPPEHASGTLGTTHGPGVMGKPRTPEQYKAITGEEWPTREVKPTELHLSRDSLENPKHERPGGLFANLEGKGGRIGPFAQNAPGQSNIPHTAEFNVPDIEVPPGTEVQRQPTFEAFTGRGSTPQASKLSALAEELKNPGARTAQGPKRTIVAGSRGVTDLQTVQDAIETAPWDASEVVSGTARGVDTLGEQWAKTRDVPVKRFPADWNRHGKRAGYLRNEQMAENADALVAVWDGKSPGTKHMIDIAKRKGIPVHVYRTDKPGGGIAKSTLTEGPGVEPTGPASEELVENALRQKLGKSGRVMKVPELQSTVRRFLAERDPHVSRELPLEVGAMPSGHAGAPLPKERKSWIGDVLSGRKSLEPGQQRHMTLQEFDQYLDRAARAGTRASDLPLRGVDPNQQAAIGQVLRGEQVPEAKIKQIRSTLGDELVPESQRAQDAGQTVTSTEELGAPTSEGVIPGEEKMQSLSELRLTPEQHRRLSREKAEMGYAQRQGAAQTLARQQQTRTAGAGRGKVDPISVKEAPSELVVRQLPADQQNRPDWLAPMQSKLQQAGKEVGGEWEAIARLRQVAELPAASRGLSFGKPKPALEELSRSPHLESLLARIDEGIEQALQKTPKEGFRPSPKFDDMMDWTKFLTPEGRANVLSRMEKKSPEAAARLRHMWTKWQGGRQKPGGTPTRPTTSELAIKPQREVQKWNPDKKRMEPDFQTTEVTRAKNILPNKPKRADLVDILVRNRDEFIDWATKRSPQLSAKQGAEERATLGRILQELLSEEGVQGIRKGDDYGLFSEHVLGAPEGLAKALSE